MPKKQTIDEMVVVCEEKLEVLQERLIADLQTDYRHRLELSLLLSDTSKALHCLRLCGARGADTDSALTYVMNRL